MSTLPEGTEIIDPPIEVKLGTWMPQKVDAKVERYGIIWYRVLGGFGGRGDREDWIADLPISVCVNDYQWNGESFGPNYGSFDNACFQESRLGLIYAERKLAELEAQRSRLTKAIRKLEEIMK